MFKTREEYIAWLAGKIVTQQRDYWDEYTHRQKAAINEAIFLADELEASNLHPWKKKQ